MIAACRDSVVVDNATLLLPKTVLRLPKLFSMTCAALDGVEENSREAQVHPGVDCDTGGGAGSCSSSSSSRSHSTATTVVTVTVAAATAATTARSHAAAAVNLHGHKRVCSSEESSVNYAPQAVCRSWNQVAVRCMLLPFTV